MEIKLLVEGGAMEPGPALAQKIGPLGLNVGEIIKKINDATKNFKGLKIPVGLTIEPSTKKIEIQVFSPPVSELLKKELGVEKGSGLQKKQVIGNFSIEQIISIAKIKQKDLLCKDLKSTVKTIIGTCTSLGILVENEFASEVGHQISEGKFSKEIKEEKTETSEEKKEKLNVYFKEVQKKQEEAKKVEEAAVKEAEEAKKAKAGAVEEVSTEEKKADIKPGQKTEPLATDLPKGQTKDKKLGDKPKKK